VDIVAPVRGNRQLKAELPDMGIQRPTRSLGPPASGHCLAPTLVAVGLATAGLGVADCRAALPFCRNSGLGLDK